MLIRPKVFYSKKVAPDHPLLLQGWDCQTTSLIECQAKNFESPEAHYDWVFFSSANGVKFGRDLIREDSQIAVIGTQTAKHLTDINIDFIGQGNVDHVSRSFAEIAKEESVLFVHGERSIKSIYKEFPSDKKMEIEVYSTALRPELVPECNVYFFTSPSNAESFLELNKIPHSAKVVAMGATTQQFLSMRGIKASIPSSFLIENQIEAIKSQLEGY
ncbi:MAG: uroporphyrinogen-III synthase [Flavobacteriales bacterium]|nr:uroporphyrinogen-III synthase [Flavobacteriales bacterium]